MKVPEPKKMPSGNWFIQLRLDGVSVPVTRATAKECKRAAELIKAEHRSKKRTVKKGDASTLREAIQAYLDVQEDPLSESTIKGYYTIMNNRFKGVIDKPINQVKDWQAVVNNEMRDYAPKTVHNSWGLLTAVFHYMKIPVPEVTLPQVIENDLPWIDPDDLFKFLDAARGDKYEIGMLLALHSLRRSEIAAITWDKIDLKNELIHVHGAAVYDRHHNLVDKKANKTEKSRRTIQIMIPRLVELLEAVEDKTGKVVPCAPNTLYRHINAVCERCGLEGVGCHGLRRSFASLAYDLDWTTKHIQQVGGWANTQVLDKLYIKLAQRRKNQDTMRMTDFFEGKDEKVNANENANA